MTEVKQRSNDVETVDVNLKRYVCILRVCFVLFCFVLFNV